LDDFSINSLDGQTRVALLLILEDRYGKKSVIITSQLPVGKWNEYIGESKIADAIMDRLAVDPHRIDLK
jgi:DNA replication protein DnaC